MSLGRRFFTADEQVTVCPADTADVFGDGRGVSLYSLDYDASDESGNYDATPSNLEFGVDGQINWGARFNGSDSRLNLGNIAGTGGTARISFSVSMWVRTTNTASNKIIATDFQAGVSTYSLILYGDSAGTLSAYNAFSLGSSVTTSTATFNDGNWRHIVVVNDATNNKQLVYLDKVKVIDQALGQGTKFATAGMKVGYYDSAGGAASAVFDGDIDQIRIFDDSLLQSEIDTLYSEAACVYTSTTDIVDYQGTNAAYYKFDNNALDETSNNYDGTESNITYEFGRYGQAAVFNGSSSKIDLPNLGTGVSGSSARSVSAWIKLDDTPSGFEAIYASGSSSNGSAFAFFVTSSKKIRLYYYNRQYDSSTVLNVGQWYHIVVTYNGGNIQGSVNSNIYINGDVETISDAGGTATGVASTTNSNYSIGYERASTNYYFDGLIDQVRIYNSALDATAVEALYNEKPEANTSNFETVLYEGNGGTQYVSNVGFEPDLVWIKNRYVTDAHVLFDSVRGATKYIMSNLPSAETTQSNTLTSFQKNGFFLGYDPTGGAMNANNESYVAWCWKAAGVPVVNNNGTTESQVSANPESGFSIVKWSGDASLTTIGHGLSSTPEIVIRKRLENISDWAFDTTAVDGSFDYLFLNSTAQKADHSSLSAPTSTVFSTGGTSYNSTSMVAYCFHSVAGYQKIGSYTGTGTSGNLVQTGFEPSWVMVKRADGAGAWLILDNRRSATNPRDKFLMADSSSAESTADGITFSTNGFSFTDADFNNNGATFIYLAIA